MLYIAYGSNMDMDQMEYRCPHASFVGTAVLKGWRLMFKGSRTGNYATIERDGRCTVPVVLWEIDQLDEHYLDRYEGYPNFYYKTEMDVPGWGRAMVYIMHEYRRLGSPTKQYYGVLENAYRRFRFPRRILRTALEFSAHRA